MDYQKRQDLKYRATRQLVLHQEANAVKFGLRNKTVYSTPTLADFISPTIVNSGIVGASLGGAYGAFNPDEGENDVVERLKSTARGAAIGGGVGLGEGALISALGRRRIAPIPPENPIVKNVATKISNIANSDIDSAVAPTPSGGVLQRIRNIGKPKVEESDAARKTIQDILNRAKRDSGKVVRAAGRAGEAGALAVIGKTRMTRNPTIGKVVYEIDDLATDIGRNGLRKAVVNKAKKDIKTTKDAAGKVGKKVVETRKKYLGFEHPRYAIREFARPKPSLYTMPYKTLGAIGAGTGLAIGAANSISDSRQRIEGNRDRDINNIYDIQNPDLRARVYRDYTSEPNQRRIANADRNRTIGSALVSGSIGAAAGLGASQVGGAAIQNIRKIRARG
jgi:hypothetical protein